MTIKIEDVAISGLFETVQAVLLPLGTLKPNTIYDAVFTERQSTPEAKAEAVEVEQPVSESGSAVAGEARRTFMCDCSACNEARKGKG